MYVYLYDAEQILLFDRCVLQVHCDSLEVSWKVLVLYAHADLA